MRVLVVGNGLIGAAAGRHLAELGHEVAIVGPPEPADPSTHDGVFASHYDQGRLVSGFAHDPLWAALGRRSIPAYDALTAATGIEILHRVGRVSAYRLSDDGRARMRTWASTQDPTGELLRFHPAGDDGWRRAAPMLEVPTTFDVLVERGDAGYLNPRALIGAQNRQAAIAGAALVEDRVVSIDAHGDGVTVVTAGGAVRSADRVVVAAGAFANAPGLLPEPLPLRWKTETTLWADVSAAAARRLAGMPAVAYDVDDPGVDDVYLAPPIVYPDGVPRIKIGANTSHETWPADVDEIAAWFRHGDGDRDRPGLERVLRSMLPDVGIGSVSTHRCIVTYTPSRFPTIDLAPRDASGRVVVATGGNGTGAQCSDALGALAARLALGEPWPDDLPRDPFLAGHEWDERLRDASRAQRRAGLRP